MPTAANPAPIHRLDDIERRIVAATRPVAFVSVAGMLIVSFLTILDVLLRWLVNWSFTGLNEFSSMVFAVALTACIPYGMAQGIHLKLDLLETHVVGRLAAWVAAVSALLVLIFLLILTWWLSIFSAELASSNRITVMLQWPKWPFMYIVTLLFVAASGVQAVAVLNAVRVAIASSWWRGAPRSSPIVWALVVGVMVTSLSIIVWAAIDFAGLSGLSLISPTLTIALSCVLLWLLLMVLVPVSAAMALIGLLGTGLFIGLDPALSAFASEVSGFLTNYQVAVLPLFLMMGSFAAVAGLADDVYALAHALLCRARGGLAMATIGGCAGFGAMTGSTIATAATIGRVALPEMRARGYSPALATGCVAAGGTLGNLVPPGSAPLVLFALLTEASIGQLFVASIIPSILAVAAYIITIMIYVRVSKDAAPVPMRPQPGELSAALRRCGPIMALFVIIMGGLYTGIFTSTEAASVGAVCAFLVAVFRGKLRRHLFWDVMSETTHTTALVYPLIFGALIFAFFTGVSGLTEAATTYVASLQWSPMAVVGLLLVVFLILGTFMDSYAILIVTIPIVTPLVTGVGYDIIWWGVLNLFIVEIGGISPPFGLTMYVLKSIDDVPIATIFKGVTPFCIAAILVTIVLVVFPSLTLWLPQTMR